MRPIDTHTYMHAYTTLRSRSGTSSFRRMGAQYSAIPASHPTADIFCVKLVNVYADTKSGGIQGEESQVPGVGESVRTSTFAGTGVHRFKASLFNFPARVRNARKKLRIRTVCTCGSLKGITSILPGRTIPEGKTCFGECVALP